MSANKRLRLWISFSASAVLLGGVWVAWRVTASIRYTFYGPSHATFDSADYPPRPLSPPTIAVGRSGLLLQASLRRSLTTLARCVDQLFSRPCSRRNGLTLRVAHCSAQRLASTRERAATSRLSHRALARG